MIIFLPVSGFEINTQQAITNCALSTECGQKGAENLNYFTLTMQLNNISYKNQVFDLGARGGSSYLKFASENEGLGDGGNAVSRIKTTCRSVSEASSDMTMFIYAPLSDDAIAYPYMVSSIFARQL